MDRKSQQVVAAPADQHPAPAPDLTGRSSPGRARNTGQQVVAALVCIALAGVILTPVALSSSDLIRWAQSPTGLGATGYWPYLVFIGLDCAALVCVGMTIISAWREESGGAFHLLTWVFAGGSATANWSHGITTPAPDDQYFFPAMSLAGPLLLDVVLMRVRRWIRKDKQHQLSSAAKFGVRWLVALGETRRAWVLSRREGISEPMVAIAMVRERQALARRSDEERVRFARMAIPGATPWQLHQWLLERGVEVSQGVLDRAAAPEPAPPARTDQVTVTVMEEAPQLPATAQQPPQGPAPIAAAVEPPAAEPDAIVPGTHESGAVAGDRIPATKGAGSGGGAASPASKATIPPTVERAEEPSPGLRRGRRTELAASDVAGLNDTDLRRQVADLTKRGRARLALETNNDDVPAGLEWLRGLGFEGAELPDKSEMYKVRTSRIEDQAKARRANVRSLSSGSSGQ